MAADFDLEPFAKLAESVVSDHRDDEDMHVCPTCGSDDAAFRSSGRFGCPDCYDAFGSVLVDVLKRVQPGLSHEGKVPVCGEQRKAARITSDHLRRELESAVREERFEDAAVLRDQLRNLGTERESES